MKQTNIQITSLQQAALSVLCYFNVFQHPLTLNEILHNCPAKTTTKKLEEALRYLVLIDAIKTDRGFYFLNEHPNTIIEERKLKEYRAGEELFKSQRYTKLISRFPFVKAVCISGSLSKGVMDKDGDVDYFIITEKQRLWVCRTMLIAFKKIFLLNSRKYFCTNYFVDVDHLEIPDKSIFTATEINHLKAVCNKNLINELVAQNSWTKRHTPNFQRASNENCLAENRNPVKRFVEICLNGRAGEKLDNYFFKLTLERWKKKFPHFTSEDFDLNMRTRKTVSKHHPRGYQQKVLQAQESKLKEILQHFELKSVEAA